MKKTTVINSELSTAIAGMGHMDWLSIGDAGMPVPMGTKKNRSCLNQGDSEFHGRFEKCSR